MEIERIADALSGNEPVRDVLAVAIRAAAGVALEQDERLTAYRVARTHLATALSEQAASAHQKARIAAQITKQAVSEGRNEAERRALAAEALAANEGYRRLDDLEAREGDAVRDAEGRVDFLKESLRFGQARLSLVSGVIAAVGTLAALER